MSHSDIKMSMNIFLHEIKFNKENYSLYNNIFEGTRTLNEEIIIFIILQLAYQTKFKGYFDELYVDVIKRRSEYIKELINNFRVSFIQPPTMYNKIYKFFSCGRMTDREIYFDRKIRAYDFDSIFDKYFGLNNDVQKIVFINNCEKIYNNEFKTKLTKIKNGSSRVCPI